MFFANCKAMVDRLLCDYSKVSVIVIDFGPGALVDATAAEELERMVEVCNENKKMLLLAGVTETIAEVLEHAGVLSISGTLRFILEDFMHDGGRLSRDDVFGLLASEGFDEVFQSRTCRSAFWADLVKDSYGLVSKYEISYVLPRYIAALVPNQGGSFPDAAFDGGCVRVMPSLECAMELAEDIV